MDLPARVARSSCRKHRLMVPMTKSSFNRAVKKLGYHPYKLVMKYVKVRSKNIFIFHYVDTSSTQQIFQGGYQCVIM